VGHPSLSVYRQEPLSLKLVSSDVEWILHDNFLTLKYESENASLAFEKGARICAKFTLLLGIAASRFFWPEIIHMVNLEKKMREKIPTRIEMGTFTTYNLEDLAKQAETASQATSIADAKLEKAAAYLGYSLLLLHESGFQTESLAFRRYMTSTQIILNSYKSVSTILGEPGVDKDAQSRYKLFGFNHETWEEAEKLRNVRNESDVAHYSALWNKQEQMFANENFALSLARKVLEHYREWLMTNGSEGQERLS
jgi:hypothetical protein